VRELTAGLPFLIIVALVAGYLVVSRDREHNEALRMRNQMLLARAVQDLMLPPRAPQVQGWDAALTLEPALEVGGDLYILEPLESGHYLVCLGDISGKSISGLIYLSLILSHTRAAAREGLPPREIARQVNARIYDTMAAETYAALFLGLLDPTSGFLSFVNCGHPPPLLIPQEGNQAVALFGGGIVIGAQRHPEYVQQSITIKHGDALVAFTDGLSELRNTGGAMWGERRIGEAALLALHDKAGAREIVDRLLAEARRWSPTAGNDDRTCLVLRRLPL
jgi:sigma-B regulation protein RsbU (phosphoserine phosphatase)